MVLVRRLKWWVNKKSSRLTLYMIVLDNDNLDRIHIIIYMYHLKINVLVLQLNNEIEKKRNFNS